MAQSCFLICPIGDDESDVRKHSDQVLRHIVKPVLGPKGYSIVRADEMPRPGVITTQIMEAIFESNLVIADLTGRNPNVYYELALRHASRKPYIQLTARDEPIPFDLAGIRTIRFNLSDPDDIEVAKITLARQVEEIEGGYTPDSPVSMALSESLFQGNENAISVFLEKFWQIEDDFERLHKSIDSMKFDISSIEGDVSSIECDVSEISKKLED